MRLIDALRLRFGQAANSPLTIHNPAVTVFVGPNNSGKSLVLREIHKYLCSVATGEVTIGKGLAIVSDLNFAAIDADTASGLRESLLKKYGVVPGAPENTQFTIKFGSISHTLTPMSVTV